VRANGKKFGFSFIRTYFWPHYEDDNELYKAGQEAVPAPGRKLIVLYDKIIRAFPHRGGFFNLKNTNQK